MSVSDEAIRASYAACRRLARRSRSSFCACFFWLPPGKRQAMEALYAFMRHTDDLADAEVAEPLRRKALVGWRAALHDALVARSAAADGHPADACLGEGLNDRTGQELLPALADAVRQYGIPPEHLTAVLDGVEMDLSERRYESFDELETYCERVASAVGLACIHIWGFRGRQAPEAARKCGIALQLTNILRDVKEDAQRDRVYLPLEDLRQFGYSVDDLLMGIANERFDRLVQHEIGRAERFYREGGELIDWLEPDCRRTFGMMMAIYRALLEKIKRDPRAVLRGRVRLGRGRKLRIAARCLWDYCIL